MASLILSCSWFNSNAHARIAFRPRQTFLLDGNLHTGFEGTCSYHLIKAFDGCNVDASVSCEGLELMQRNCNKTPPSWRGADSLRSHRVGEVLSVAQSVCRYRKTREMLGTACQSAPVFLEPWTSTFRCAFRGVCESKANAESCSHSDCHCSSIVSESDWS